MTFTRKSIRSLNKKLKDIANITNDEIVRLPSQFKYMQWYISTLINTESKLYIPELPNVTNKPPKNTCHVQFSNKEIELMNLP